jgi:hypothetical protein
MVGVSAQWLFSQLKSKPIKASFFLPFFIAILCAREKGGRLVGSEPARSCCVGFGGPLLTNPPRETTARVVESGAWFHCFDFHARLKARFVTTQ